jgi:hypothetical protein
MAELLEKIVRPDSGPWLDYTGYAGELLAGGNIPWTSIDGVLAWVRQAQGLLRSSVVSIPVAPIVEAWLDEHPALRSSMAARSRTTYPIKTLLADSSLRTHLNSLFAAVGASLSSVPVVATIPSPRVWVLQCYRQAFGQSQCEVDDDVTDSAAAYIADFLRSLPQTELAGLLLDESAEAGAPSIETVKLYQPIFNLGNHYRWDVGVYAPQSDASALTSPSWDGGPAFWIMSDPVAGKDCGVLVPATFWYDNNPIDHRPARFRFATIPRDAVPEVVLRRLPDLRWSSA